MGYYMIYAIIPTYLVFLIWFVRSLHNAPYENTGDELFDQNDNQDFVY